MAKKRGKRGENSYLNDFHPNLAGEYIYDGALYACQSDPVTQKKSRRRLWGCTALLLIGFGIQDSILPMLNRQTTELNHSDLIVP